MSRRRIKVIATGIFKVLTEWPLSPALCRNLDQKIRVKLIPNSTQDQPLTFVQI